MGTVTTTAGGGIAIGAATGALGTADGGDTATTTTAATVNGAAIAVMATATIASTGVVTGASRR